jgi:hypothetical protein
MESNARIASKVLSSSLRIGRATKGDSSFCPLHLQQKLFFSPLALLLFLET